MNNEARMWLCRFYHQRGLALTDEQWRQFKEFCERADFTEEPTMGQRADGRDKWRVHFGLDREGV